MHPQSNGQTGGALDAAINHNRIEALKKLMSALLTEVQSLEAASTMSAKNSIHLGEEVRRFEIDLIRCALARTSGNQRRAASLLGIKATTLNSKIKRYKIRL